MSAPPYDPRAVANLLLDRADRDEVPVTNLALQKLLYFAHAHFLIQTKRPLVSGFFEAWQYGPVHPAIYHTFKAAEDRPITFRATRRDVMTGAVSVVDTPDSAEVRRIIREILSSYGRLTPGRLVEISHAKRAPWHFVVGKSKTTEAFGLRIPDDVIITLFKHHKVPVRENPMPGEPREESPFIRD